MVTNGRLSNPLLKLNDEQVGEEAEGEEEEEKEEAAEEEKRKKKMRTNTGGQHGRGTHW